MYEIVEPRIEILKKEVDRLLSLVQLEKNGNPIAIDGFRLRNLADWQTSIAQNIFDVLGPLSGICNVHCSFCMERTIPFERSNTVLSLSEANTRFKYYLPDSKRCLFPSPRPHLETFLNKDAITILKKARHLSPEELFIVTTNGTTLTPDIVTELKGIKPIFIKLSVNSMNLETRNSLMGLRDSMTSVQSCMEMLKAAGIPFSASLVAWPDIEDRELESSLVDLVKYLPYGLRIRLPLVHKYSPKKPDRDMVAYWGEISGFIDSIRGKLAVPTWIEPIQFGRPPLVAMVDGIIANSPAAREGLLPGDLIVSIDDKDVYSRFEIRELFASTEFTKKTMTSVQVRRNGRLLSFTLDSEIKTGLAYPYDSNLGHPGERFGMLLLPDFDIGFLDNILRLSLKHSASRILLFASPLTAGTVEHLINGVRLYKNFFKERDLCIYTLERTWMEGNTVMLDSRFVEDYEQAILKVCKQPGFEPDLILIPDCFGSAWGTDFKGRSIYEVEREVGVPIELIPWHYIYGRED